MKYTLAFIGLSLLLTACRPSGAKIQRELTDTWVVDFGSEDRMTNTIRPDGSYEAQIFKYASGRTSKDVGTLLSKNGVLIYTRTTSSDTNVVQPVMVYGQIIRLDDNELVAKWGSISNAIIARKAER